MSHVLNDAPSAKSSMFELKPWEPDYDVATRMSELQEFWARGVTPALYDALKHLEANRNLAPPQWVMDAALKVVEDRLRAGFETKQKAGKRNDERKLYQAEIRDYYRWRAVWKHHLAGATWDKAYGKAHDDLVDTFAEGERETMKKAYAKVAADMKVGAKAFRYYSAMPETRELTGTSLVPGAYTAA
jgi:hypothetical protein